MLWMPEQLVQLLVWPLSTLPTRSLIPAPEVAPGLETRTPTTGSLEDRLCRMELLDLLLDLLGLHWLTVLWGILVVNM
jgi:hypothetical protein